MENEDKLEKLRHILQIARDNEASDIHLAPRSPIMLRIDGELVRADEPMTEPYEIEQILEAFLTDAQRQALDEAGELDFAYSVPGFSRLRINVFRQRGTYAMAIRLLSFDVPNPETLGLPNAVTELANLKRGLVLITGATGTGKSTTLAALVNLIANNYAKTIITLEDPIEYLHKHGSSMVLQREVGFDTKNYANALRAALRQDPDVILVGEMRDLDTIATAITAAETGHLVLSTLHTNSAVDAIDRMIDVFPPHQQQQIRVQLASVLEAVVAQQLLPVENGDGRKAVFEVLLSNPAIQNMIREGKSQMIRGHMQTSRKEGMITMDDAIYELYVQSIISKDTAVTFALEPGQMLQKVR